MAVTDSDEVVSYAAYYGVDAATATAEIAEMPGLSSLQDNLSQLAPNEFGGLWVDHRPYRVTVAVTGYTDAIDSAIRGAGLRSTPEIVIVQTSLAALDEALMSLSSIEAAHDAYVDVKGNRVVIDVLSSGTVSSERRH